MKVAICQRILPSYRLPVFRKLAGYTGFDVKLFYGKIANAKYGKNQSINITGDDRNFCYGLQSWCLFFTLRQRLFPFVFFPSLFVELLRYRPDVILTEGESNLPNNLIIFIYSKLFNIPYVWWGLGRVRTEKESVIRKTLRKPIGILLNQAGAVISYSTFGKQYYISQGALANRTFVASNSLDTDQIDKEIEIHKGIVASQKKQLKLDNRNVLLFVGAFEKTKKIDLLIEAFAAIKSDFPATTLLLVGDGDERRNLEAKCDFLKVEDVIFVGKKIQDVSLYFLMADIFVLPGLGGLAINHAMCHRLPVVVSSADGTEEDLVHHGETGFIVPGDDVQAFVEHIRILLQNSNLRNKMGNNARKIVEESININTMIGSIVTAIETAAQSQK